MSDCVLYHNPRCSKSRQAKQLLDDRGIDYQTRLYLKDPLNQAELEALIAKLGIQAHELVRTGDAEYQAAGLRDDSSEAAVLQALVDYPKLVQRPIVSGPGGVRIGRPPEAILDIL